MNDSTDHRSTPPVCRSTLAGSQPLDAARLDLLEHESFAAMPRGKWARRGLFAALYFSEGAPIGFIWWYLPTLLRSRGIAIERVTMLTAAVAWPWVLKFLWAPLIDALRSKSWGYRAWIVTMQLLMAGAVVPLLWLKIDGAFGWAAALLLAHAVFASTQDVAIDAWAINITPKCERGSLTGFMQAGMLVARWAFGAGLLIFSSRVDQSWAVLLLITAILSSLVLVAFSGSLAHREDGPAKSVSVTVRQFSGSLRSVLKQSRTWAAIVFALTGGVAFESVGAVAGPFLIDRDLSQTQIGFFFSGNVVTMLLGGLLGGNISDRFARVQAVAGSIVLIAFTVLLLAGLDLAFSSHIARLLCMLAIYFGIGIFTASSYALFMDVTDPRLGGTQFSAFMGATNACEAMSALVVGFLIVRMGYPAAFAIMAAASLGSIIPLSFLNCPTYQSDGLPADGLPSEPTR